MQRRRSVAVVVARGAVEAVAVLAVRPVRLVPLVPRVPLGSPAAAVVL